MLFATPQIESLRRDDGSIRLRSTEALGDIGRCVGDWLVHWAAVAPDRPFLRERDASGAWTGVTYGEALARVRTTASWLLENRCSPERPVAVLCDNSVRHGLTALAAMHVGIPVAPISSAYSLVSTDYVKLKGIIEEVGPGAIFAGDRARFGTALAAIGKLHDAVVVCDDVETAGPAATVDRYFQAIAPDTVAKLLFTSGSTGTPKAVITTQRMLLANQQQIRQVWPFLREHVPVLVDWLPWSHTFGGSHNFNMVLRAGGSLYIDAGRPIPQRFSQTLTNLRDIAPTLYFNVPRGMEMLLAALRADRAFREHFCSELKLVLCAAAALPQHVWEEMKRLLAQSDRGRVAMTSAWGATETAPVATSCHFAATTAGVIGLPVPGVELKLVPRGPKLEVRVAGPNVTPGYWKHPELTRKAFDEDGFYLIGDAVKPVDPDRFELGLLFDGRVSEDFKLSSGTWVNAGALRLKAIAALAPVVQDAVVTGHDRDSLGLLLFPNMAACRQLCSDLGADASITEVLASQAVREHVRAGLRAMRNLGVGSSTYATAALLLPEPPSIDAGEITDKGYINQRRVLERRQHLVESLYSRNPSAERIDLS